MKCSSHLVSWISFSYGKGFSTCVSNFSWILRNIFICFHTFLHRLRLHFAFTRGPGIYKMFVIYDTSVFLMKIRSKVVDRGQDCRDQEVRRFTQPSKHVYWWWKHHVTLLIETFTHQQHHRIFWEI